MPNIRSFDAPQGLGLNPTETGIDAAANAGKRIGGFYNQVAEAYNTVAGLKNDEGSRIAGAVKDVGQVAVDYMDHREISAGAAKGTELMADVTAQWNKIIGDPKIDPNDPSIAAKFREETLEPALEKFQSGFSTEKSQQFAEQFVERYRNHIAEKTTADMSSLAGVAAKRNISTTVNSLGSMVALDPSALDTALDTFRHALGATVDSSPTLDGVTKASVRSELGLSGEKALVHAAAIGMIAKNPNVDLDAFQKKYGDLISPGEMLQLKKAAQTQAKVDAYHDKSAAIAQRQLDDQKVHAGATKTITDNVQVDPQTNQVTINPKFFNDALEIARKNPDAPSAGATVRTMLDWGESQLNKERKVVTDPAATSAIDANMFTDNPTSKMDILKLEAAGKLTRSDAEIRTKIIDQRDKLPSDPQFKMAMDGAKELIEGRSAGEKSLQSGKYAAFMQQFLSDYQRQKTAGTLPPNALSLRDPNSLLSKTMEAYKSPLAAAISGNGGVGAAPAPRNDTMPAIPPASERPAGSVYETPRGKMKWTGTGWVAP